MFRLHKHSKPSKSGERIDFKFSNFQALQVPKGWDKLFVSIISVETGKTIAKSGKALARNGNCQWSESLSESIWLSQDDSSKEIEECLFKLVVSMGSARSGILGEATVNMAGYTSSRASVPVSLPLKKCNYGTILQVKIHCLTPRTKPRDEDSKDCNSNMEDQNADMESKSNGSNNSFSKSDGSSSSKDLGSASHPAELESRETSFSASGSHNSFDSAESSMGKETSSARDNLNTDCYNQDGRQGSNNSQNSSLHGNFHAHPSQSNHSSFNSRVMDSRNDSQNNWQEFRENSSHVIASSSLTNASSSKNLLEAAEDTIEELHAEAKMWERNGRKLMLDLDILRKEFSDQSKKHADLEMELSAAYTERDGLKNEVEQLKIMLEEAIVKQTVTGDSTFKSGGTIHFHKELEDELKVQQESNANLALQLKRSQESNIELVTVLQELEETIERQKVEIENFSVPQLKFSGLEYSIQGNLEENKNLQLQLQQLQESENKLQAKVQLLERALEDKSNGIENERSLDTETGCKCKISAKEEEIASFEAKLRQSDDMGSANGSGLDLIREIESLKEKMQELERDCSELTDENLELLFKIKDLQSNSVRGCSFFDSLSSEFPAKSFDSSESQVSELKSQVRHLEEELKKRVIEEDQLAAFEMSRLFHDLLEQFQMAFYHVKKPWYNISSHENNEFETDLENLANLTNTVITNPKVMADSILNLVIDLNKLLESRILECEKVLKDGEVKIKETNDNAAEAQKKLEDYVLKENNLCLSIEELESLKIKLEANLTDIGKEMAEKRSETERLEVDLLLKEEEIGFLRQCQRQLEADVSDLQKEKIQLEENVEIVSRESSITSKCLDDLRNDLMVLSSSVDSHVSANQSLERKSSELEKEKHELELHVLEMEKENMQLSVHISGLESQLKYMTDGMESSRLELENSKSVSMSLQDEIRRLGTEMETQKLDLKQKLQDMQNQWSEAEEECEYLKIENQKLEASTENLVQEFNTLQKSNGELRKQKLELHQHCTHLDAELKESQQALSDCSRRVEALEETFSSMLEDFSLKEKSLTTELDSLLQENAKQKEKLVLGESLLNQMYLEKSSEVENLQRKVEHLTKEISAIHDESERKSSEAMDEVSNLHADKAELESSLQEVQSKVKLIENDLVMVQTESNLKVQGLMVELAASKESNEILTAEHGKMLKMLGNYRSNEEKLKTAVNDLELKLTLSEYERQQLIQETANLKVQLQKIAHLQDDVLALKSEVNASKFEKEKLEASLLSLSGDCEELKAEKISLVEKISSLQNAISGFEDCKRKRVSLEEKLLQMESDLTEKEALCAQDAETKNELTRIKRANKQFQRNIQQLEVEKDECLKRVQALEEELKLIEEKQDRSKSRSKKNGIVKSTNQHRDNGRKPSVKADQAQESSKDPLNPYGGQHQREVDKEYDFHNGSPHSSGMDHVAKIQSLENELAEALEANLKYKIQLQRFLPEGQNGHAAAPRKSTAEGEVVAKERYERTKSSLETELKDLRERYFHMSLKYAEVEAQREDLVMKLKTVKNGKRWFL